MKVSDEELAALEEAIRIAADSPMNGQTFEQLTRLRIRIIQTRENESRDSRKHLAGANV